MYIFFLQKKPTVHQWTVSDKDTSVNQTNAVHVQMEFTF